ncbi:cation diffusion facilitator family transporter [Phenylobacterium sp.]|jgi:cobalt-zinc-cadmium efflux system protein|uniref:cation diffusion facilitator family transporter n=1 Tax=Phenylobacterium sp. TaxID=1871053 RepID=UPI0037C80099
MAPSTHDHAHGHDHAHRHGDHHDHFHASPSLGRAFAVGVALNGGFVAVEVAAGFWTGSLALLADAGHNLSDVLALLLAWGAAGLASRAPRGRHTYGLGKATVLASLANAVLLLVAVGAIVSEAVRRFAQPAPVDAGVVMVVAGLGIVINTATALMFLKSQHSDLNARGAFLHMAADAGVSLAVVLGALLMSVTGFLWIDPALSIVVALVIVIGTWGLLRDSFDLAVDAAPRRIDVADVRRWLATRDGVIAVHDLHVWALSTTATALTAHIVRPDNPDPDGFLQSVSEGLAQEFGIGHATLQVETDPDHACASACDEAA